MWEKTGKRIQKNDYKSKRLYRKSISTSASQQSTFDTKTARRPLSQSLRQQRHDRPRIYFSSSAQESSSLDAESDVPDNTNTDASDKNARGLIDPNEVEIERRKVKDVPIREVLDVSFFRFGIESCS